MKVKMTGWFDLVLRGKKRGLSMYSKIYDNDDNDEKGRCFVTISVIARVCLIILIIITKQSYLNNTKFLTYKLDSLLKKKEIKSKPTNDTNNKKKIYVSMSMNGVRLYVDFCC